MIAVRVFALDSPSRAQGTHDRNNRALIRSSYGFVPETPYMKLSMYSLGKGLSTIQNIFGANSSPYAGKLVAQAGSLLGKCEVRQYPSWILDTVHLKRAITSESFAVPMIHPAETNRVTVIEMIDRQIINKRITANVPVQNGKLCTDVPNDILKLAVVERYGRNGNVGVGFVKGFQLNTGALAFSTSHDHHNIVVVGTNDEDMAAAVNEVAHLHGGLAAAKDGLVIDSMSLPIGGLMSDRCAEDVMQELDKVNRSVGELGCPFQAPFMALSFISLPTVPELGLTDMGLVDVLNHKLISL